MRAGCALTLPVAAEDRSVSLVLQLLSPLPSPSRPPFQMPPLKSCCSESWGSGPCEPWAMWAMGCVSCGLCEPWAVWAMSCGLCERWAVWAVGRVSRGPCEPAVENVLQRHRSGDSQVTCVAQGVKGRNQQGHQAPLCGGTWLCLSGHVASSLLPLFHWCCLTSFASLSASCPVDIVDNCVCSLAREIHLNVLLCTSVAKPWVKGKV